MFQVNGFIEQLMGKYEPPMGDKIKFDMQDILTFENRLGVEFPSDFYDFLKAYGYGSFDDYFYIWNPFIKNGIEHFIQENEQAKENYKYLGMDWSEEDSLYCKFSNDKLIVLKGNPKYAETLRAEKIDSYTRSKIIALGNHYPYEFFPNEMGLIYFGRTDDDDFFLRIHGTKTSIVMYGANYYEFDMGVTEFIYGYLTKKIKLPMQDDETDWTFVTYEDMEK